MSNTPLFIPSLGNKFVDYRQPILGDSFNWSWNRPITQVDYLVYHHSVTSHDATPDDIALLHKARGWGGIGYHFVITKDGTVWYVGDIGTARANVLDKNEKVIGICMIGDFTKHLPSDEQINSAHILGSFLIGLASISNVKSWDNVVGHKDLQATACPGSSWNGQLGGMMDRIQKNIPYTPPVTPEEIVEADSTIAKGTVLLSEYRFKRVQGTEENFEDYVKAVIINDTKTFERLAKIEELEVYIGGMEQVYEDETKDWQSELASARKECLKKAKASELITALIDLIFKRGVS